MSWQDSDSKAFIDSQDRKHSGVLKIDGTCADAEVRYPVDVDLVNDGCRIIEEYTTGVCKLLGQRKPLTPYKSARGITINLFYR